jgi:ketosteroid isomerase-like protein
MSRNVLSAALSLLVSLVVLSFTGCQPAAPDTNREAASMANASPTPINKSAIETELLQVEREWTAAAQKHDADAIKRIEADDIILTYPDGTTGTKADDVRDAESGALTVEAWDVSDAKVIVLDANTAIVTGRSTVKNGKYKGTDGKTIDISGQYRFTDVFVRRNGRWQVVASQTTKILNPIATPSPAVNATPSKPTP